MSDNGFIQWTEVHFATIRSTLIITGALFAIAGFCAAIANNWHLGAVVFPAAFLCKWSECWLLERRLVAVQLELEAS